jgi:hypothetical protein
VLGQWVMHGWHLYNIRLMSPSFVCFSVPAPFRITLPQGRGPPPPRRPPPPARRPAHVIRHNHPIHSRRGDDVMRELLAAGVRRFEDMPPAERHLLAHRSATAAAAALFNSPCRPPSFPPVPTPHALRHSRAGLLVAFSRLSENSPHGRLRCSICFARTLLFLVLMKAPIPAWQCPDSVSMRSTPQPYTHACTRTHARAHARTLGIQTASQTAGWPPDGPAALAGTICTASS